MAQVFVCNELEMKDGDVRIVRQERIEVGVYRYAGSFYAYRNHCLHQGGRHVAPEHLTLMQDCVQICATSADFMLRNSALHKHTCRACAAVCKQCAEDCRAMGDDEQMQTCAPACARCAQSCERMAA